MLDFQIVWVYWLLVVLRAVCINIQVYFNPASRIANHQTYYNQSVEEMRKILISPFIQLIWDIVSDPSSDEIITWNPNGTSFCILDPTYFAEEILTKNFKHANVSSFIRQLNMYNFHKNKSNTKELQFFHKLFRRDAKQLLIGIKRKPSEADHQEGEKMLKQFLLKKYENKSEDHSKEEVSQNTHSEAPFSLNFSSKKYSAFTDQSERPNVTLPLFLTKEPPKKILNIIIITKPSVELE